MIATPCDVKAFASKMIEVLDDPEHAAAVGTAERCLVDERFHHSFHEPRQLAFIESLAAAPTRGD